MAWGLMDALYGYGGQARVSEADRKLPVSPHQAQTASVGLDGTAFGAPSETDSPSNSPRIVLNDDDIPHFPPSSIALLQDGGASPEDVKPRTSGQYLDVSADVS